MILYDKTKAEFGYSSLEEAVNRNIFYCICDYCGTEFTRCKRTILQCNEIVTKDSCGKGLCKKTKSEEVQMIKYGVVNIGSSPEKVIKRRKTSLERYGAENYQNSNICKERNQEKYGTDFPMQTDEVKQKVKDTRIKTFGVDHHTKSPEYQKRQQEQNLAKYGEIHFSKTEGFKEKVRATNLERYGSESFFKSDTYAQILKDKYNGTLNNNYGKAQRELADFLLSLGYKFESDRELLNGKEIDLFNKELKLGIEHCGNFWHHEFSPIPRLRSYHFDKYNTLKQKDIRLITIFEDEWKYKKEQCKGILSSILGKSTRIFARECELVDIEIEVFNKFCSEYHLLDKPIKIKFCCGLTFNGELIAAVSLGDHHRSKNKNTIVLTRLCFKSGIQVIGGASRLFKQCIKWSKNNGFTKLISWSDNRWSEGNVYTKNGFTLEKELPPDYSYVPLKGGKIIRLSKQSCKKSLTKCPLDKTEREWMAENGYARIWDCGKKRWIINL